jgi:hypothetical protein
MNYEGRAALVAVGLTVASLLILAMGLRAQTAQGLFADEEVLKGTADGVNDTFTIVRAPLPWISLKVYRNGIRLRRCRAGIAGPCDYTLIAPYNKLVFVPGQIPLTGDLLLADYRY